MKLRKHAAVIREAAPWSLSNSQIVAVYALSIKGVAEPAPEGAGI